MVDYLGGEASIIDELRNRSDLPPQHVDGTRYTVLRSPIGRFGCKSLAVKGRALLNVGMRLRPTDRNQWKTSPGQPRGIRWPMPFTLWRPKGWPAGMHVHNELIIEVPKNSVTVEQVTTVMWEAPR